MFATVTVWRLGPSLQTEIAQNAILPELTSRAIVIARDFGILDFIMVPVGPDKLIVISSYETEDDARGSGPPLLSFLFAEYGENISLINRDVGRAWEPRDFVSHDRDEARLWRDDATAMFANINRYQLDPSIVEPSALDAFLIRISEQFLAVLAQMNLLDMLVVRTGDELTVVRLFENPEAFDQAMTRAKEFFADDPFEGKLTLIENLRGRAFDANFLVRP